MESHNDTAQSGYANPPVHTRFAKGKSGNPKGRPKGSKHLATLLSKIGSERVKATGNGTSRLISKIEATLHQLMNQAASGDLRAIRELLRWHESLTESEATVLPPAVPHERDKMVMASIVERIRQSLISPSENKNHPTVPESSSETKES